MSLKRCEWAEGQFPEYLHYHDKEWGVPVHDDRTHFEFLVLEGAQAGLSWATILKKRSGYRKAFANFNPEKIVRFSEADLEQILQDKSIVRNKLKVKSVRINARCFLKVQEEFGSFDNYVWEFVGGNTIHNHWKTLGECPSRTTESDKLSKDLKNRGFKFVGSTIIYAYMQACGLVNDHTIDCFRHAELLRGHA